RQAYTRFVSQASQHRPGLRHDSDHAAKQDAAPFGMVSLPDSRHGGAMGAIEFGPILHQEHHVLALELLTRLVVMWLHQRLNSPSAFIESARPGCHMFPGLVLAVPERPRHPLAPPHQLSPLAANHPGPASVPVTT